MVYLPGEKLLIEADHISPRNGQVRPAPSVKEFVDKLDKLNLDVATIVGIHGDQASMQAARAAAKGGEEGIIGQESKRANTTNVAKIPPPHSNISKG